jgi:NADPH:quinone reductase-like Zn-dependent oxidoreductase
MRAVMVSDGAPARLKVGEVQEPETAHSEALVRVWAVSLNRGEVRRSQTADPGFRPGWDLAGNVERAAPAVAAAHARGRQRRDGRYPVGNSSNKKGAKASASGPPSPSTLELVRGAGSDPGSTTSA